jgi:uncharacterized protein
MGGRLGDMMTTDERRAAVLHGDTRVNVASLLQEPVGSTREIGFNLNTLYLDDELSARDVRAAARLTRLKDAILVTADIEAVVPLECATCLAEFDQPVSESFSEPFRQTVDVRTGAQLPEAANGADAERDDEPAFTIDESHELDLAEALRQWIVLAIPMQPSCGPECPGPPVGATNDDEAIDDRFASLASLLDDEAPGT